VELGGAKFILFFSSPRKRRNPIHIAHIAKAPRANADAEALAKSAILPTHALQN